MSPNEHKQTRSEQRNAAREKAREIREQHARKERSKKVWVRGGIAAVAAAAIIVVVVTLVSGINAQNNKTTGSPANLTFDSGIKIGAGLKAFTADQTPTADSSVTPVAGKTAPNIKIYLDFQCPICNLFEDGNSEQLRSWVETGAATVEYHPVSFLDGRGSPNTYSSRAANAAICVANYSPNNFFDYVDVLFTNQPAEGTPGPENPELISRVKEVGAANQDKIAQCINDKAYATWVSDTTTAALTKKLPGTDINMQGTPTILVNGQQYPFASQEELVNPARFAAWVQQVSK